MPTTKLYAASTFYHTYALLIASRYYMNDLIDSKEVSFSLKRDLRTLCNRISDLERSANNTLKGAEHAQWKREWTDKDFQVFASVLGKMVDMPEDKRAVLEEFATELDHGNVTMEIKVA